MEHIAAFMLLVGCTSDASVCKEIPVSMPAYETVQDCQADLPLQIRMSGAVDNRVYGACKAVSEEVFEESASIEWTVSRSGQLLVDFKVEPQQVASR